MSRVWILLCDESGHRIGVAGVNHLAEIPRTDTTLLPEVIGALKAPFTARQTSLQMQGGCGPRASLF